MVRPPPSEIPAGPCRAGDQSAPSGGLPDQVVHGSGAGGLPHPSVVARGLPLLGAEHLEEPVGVLRHLLFRRPLQAVGELRGELLGRRDPVAHELLLGGRRLTLRCRLRLGELLRLGLVAVLELLQPRRQFSELLLRRLGLLLGSGSPLPFRGQRLLTSLAQAGGDVVGVLGLRRGVRLGDVAAGGAVLVSHRGRLLPIAPPSRQGTSQAATRCSRSGAAAAARARGPPPRGKSPPASAAVTSSSGSSASTSPRRTAGPRSDPCGRPPCCGCGHTPPAGSHPRA